MSRAAILDRAAAHFDGGAFLQDLARRVAVRTESQDPASGPELQRYLEGEIGPARLVHGARRARQRRDH